nr:retrovirus-related Pol polyprotein from transposon TNT 1-94 [Tanacetum cinerariifolium]
DLYGPMRVESVNGKKYILVIVDDYSRFTWVKFLRSKDETLDFIIKFLKMIQVRLKVPVCRIRTENGTEFVNQTLREYYEEVGISHGTSVARSPQQNGVVERRNRTLIKAARTMLIYAQVPLFLWTEAVATACFTQNRSIIRFRHGKTPYEVLHSKLPDLSFFHVFDALCYPTNDSENLGKLQPKADIGIFIGYAPIKKAFRIYNRRTRRIVETIHVDFDELMAMATEHRSSGPALNEMTPGTITIAPIAEVIPPGYVDSTGSPSSTMIEQDAPSTTHMGNDPLFGVPILEVTSAQSRTPASPQAIVQSNHPMPHHNSKWTKDHPLNNITKVAHMGNDLLLCVPITKVASGPSSSTASPQANVQPNNPMTYPNSKWTKDHPLNYIIGPLSRPVSTRLQLHEQALFCYYDAFLTSVEPKTYKEALNQACWIEAMLEQIHEFERLEHTMEQAAILREIVEQAKSLNPLDSASYYACKYVKLIQELLGYVRDTCLDIHKPSEKLVAVTPINKRKTVRRPKVPKTNGSNSKPKIAKSIISNKTEPDSDCSKHMSGDRSQLTNFVHKFLDSVKFGNDHIVKIMRYGDYQIMNITISRVYYMEGLGHNLLSIGQFCNSDLEAAFKKDTYFVHNLEGVDLLPGSRETSLYTLSIRDMMASSPIYNGIEFVNQTLRSYYKSVGISHETSVARSSQKNGVFQRQNRTLVKAARTMLIYAKAPLFLWAKVAATACYTQNRSIIRHHYEKTPYELLHDRKPDLSYLHVFGALCYPNNDSEDLGKFQGLGLQFITPATSSLELVTNSIPQQPCNPPLRDDWDHLFQTMFYEYFNPQTIAVSPVPVIAVPRAVDLADSPVSTSIDQDAPSIKESPSKKKPTKAKKDVTSKKKPASKPKPTKKKELLEADRGKGVPDEQQRKTSGADKRTDSGDDESNDDNSDEVTKDDDEDDVESDANDDNEASDSDKIDFNKEENLNLDLNDDEKEEKEEEDVRTPDSFEFNDDDEEYDELYKDVNVRSKVTEHEEKTEGSKQSSSVSFDFARKFLNLDNVPPVINEVASMMNVKTPHEKLSTQRGCEDKDKDEDLPAGSDQRLKKRKTRNDALRGSKSKESKSSSSKDQGDDLGNTKDQPNVKEASKHDWFKKLERPPTTDLDWNVEHLVRLAFNLLQWTCKSRVELEFHFEECYKAVTDKLDWTNPKGQEYPFILSKPLPLIEDQEDMVPSLWSLVKMFTRCVVILKRVEDLQQRVKSYQKKLNITRPKAFRFDITKMTPYTTYNDPQGIIYQDKFQRNSLICLDELYKFYDDTLSSVRRVLHDIASSLEMHYLPQRRWIKLDKKRSRIMIKAIDQ